MNTEEHLLVEGAAQIFMVPQRMFRDVDFWNGNPRAVN
jgi:hypothetical protein